MVAHPVRYTYREYLALDEASNVKLEYLGGQIFAMAGGSPEHAALQAMIPSLLYPQFPQFPQFPQLRGGPCRVFASDLRIRVAATGLATYPDVTVVCGPREFDQDDANTVVNPTVLFEVLSPSTEAYDRGEKFESYKRLPSLRHYVLVAQDAPRVEVWTRDDDDAWSVLSVGAGEVATLQALGATLDVDELYASS